MLDRTVAPPFQRTTHFELIEPISIQLPNGVHVHFLSGGQQEVIKIELIFKAGRWFEKTWGAAHFAGSLISKGSKKYSSYEIASVFDLYGAHLEVNPGLDVVSVALYSLTKNLRPVLELLLDIVTSAMYPEKELQQSKSIYIQNLKVNKEKTSFQASKLFRKSLFGENHPYGKELEENELDQIKRETIVEHFQTFFKELFVVVSGKVSDESRNIISEMFTALPTKVSNSNSYITPEKIAERIVVEKDDSVQASVRIGKRFIGRNHPDYYDVLLLCHVLGGYFGSRLMKNIREEKGLTYGVYSSIHTLINDNYLVIGADVNKENLDLTFSEIRKELSRLRHELVPADELQIARNHFIGSLQAEITTPFSHADKLKNIIMYSLKGDYYAKLISRLDSVSAEDLRIAGDKYFHEESFFEIAVG